MGAYNCKPNTFLKTIAICSLVVNQNMMPYAVFVFILTSLRLALSDVCHQADNSCSQAVLSDSDRNTVNLLQMDMASKCEIPTEQLHHHMGKLSQELHDSGVVDWESKCNCPVTVAQLKRVHGDVGSALAAGDAEMCNEYGKVQAMMSRIQEVKERYPSGFPAFWVTIPKMADDDSVSVDSFQTAWAGLGMTRHSLIGQLSTVSSEQEQSMARTADDNSDGAISREEAVNYLHTCIEVTSNMITTMTPLEFCDGDDAPCNRIGAWLGL